jgi:hypothetical protein
MTRLQVKARRGRPWKPPSATGSDRTVLGAAALSGPRALAVRWLHDACPGNMIFRPRQGHTTQMEAAAQVLFVSYLGTHGIHCTIALMCRFHSILQCWLADFDALHYRVQFFVKKEALSFPILMLLSGPAWPKHGEK